MLAATVGGVANPHSQCSVQTDNVHWKRVAALSAALHRALLVGLNLQRHAKRGIEDMGSIFVNKLPDM